MSQSARKNAAAATASSSAPSAVPFPLLTPGRFAALVCSAAVLFAACTVKKAEVTPDGRDDSAYSEESAPLPTTSSRPKAAGKKTDATATAPLSPALEAHAYGGRAEKSKERGKDAVLDRLYPQGNMPVTIQDELLANAAPPADYRSSSQASAIGQAAASGQPYAAAPRKSEAHKGQDALAKNVGPASSRLAGRAPRPGVEMKRDLYADKRYQQESDIVPEGDCYRCMPEPMPPQANTEEYAPIYENAFLAAQANPLSTFSIDVDGASYSNTRRFIQEGGLPPADAVRLEEFVNYFDYNYPQPNGSDPFSITTEVAATPWNPDTKLVHIGLQGRRMESEKLPPNNLVFLIDVSGSMDSPEKLPLLKNSFHMLIDQMRPQDRVSIVVYAGAAGMVLAPTSGSDKETIREALERLQAGGSTAGGAGLMLAYQAAKQSFIKGGSNRVIIATDGDFNVGISNDDELVRLIEEKRKSGVFLSVLGFGTGNYKDAKMEQLADKGNGNYFYIDNINEGRKVLVEKLAGTLFAIAKDVKLQIEFNPAQVKSYRLVGYENRVLAAEDFNDDRKDAGELGAGTSVTALYEIVPAAPARPKVDPLKYQNNGGSRWRWSLGGGAPEAELLTVKFRYKQPAGTASKLLSRTLRNADGAWQDASENFRFSAAAAGFGMLLRGSQYSGNLDLDKVSAMARGARGRDQAGHRAEFITLVERAKSLYAPRQVGYRQYGSRGE